MQILAIAIAKWVLPVPVPPISTELRCWATKPPLARSRTKVSLIGVPWNWRTLSQPKFRLLVAASLPYIWPMAGANPAYLRLSSTSSLYAR